MSDSPSENRASNGANWLRRGVFGVVLLLLLLVAAEAMVRLEDWIRYRTPLGKSLKDQSELTELDATGRHPVPGSRFGKWHINALGTRGPEADSARAGSRVLVLGASETFGLYESADHEYPRQLADSLTRASCAADVLNAGFIGMSLPTVEQDLRLRLRALAPRVVVYYPTPPQYAEGIPVAATPDSSGRSIRPEPAWHFRFGTRAYNQLKSMFPVLSDWLRQRDIAAARKGTASDWVFQTVPDSQRAAFEHDLRRLVGTIHSIRATPILVTHANGFVATPPLDNKILRAWERQYPRATGAALVQFDSVTAGIIRQVAADSGVALVDAWQGFHQVSGRESFADFSHFTDRGAGTMAGLLRPAVSGALGCK
ncbi:MAG: SGNH/GDSL hydrolase family protein [Gemmatimonadota bacterium]